MNLLSIETSGPIFSIVIWSDNAIIASKKFEEPMIVSKKIATAISELFNSIHLDFDQINYVLYNCGPGSFTGLRVGLSFIKGLFFNEQEKIVPIASFDILLQFTTSHIPMFESKRDEIYYYQDEKIHTLKKSAFKEVFNRETKFVTYHQPKPDRFFEGYEFKIVPYDAENLIKVFLNKMNSKPLKNKQNELIYVYE